MTILGRLRTTAMALCLVASSAAAQIPESYESVRPPTTMLELLQNIRFVAEQGMLLRDDFYTTQTVERFLAKSGHIHQDRDEDRFEGSILVDDSECGFEVRSVRLDPTLQRPYRRIVIGCRRGGPTFELVEQVLGRDWKNSLSPLPPHGRRPEPLAGVPHSYANIVYRRAANASIIVTFGADGGFYHLQLSVLDRR